MEFPRTERRLVLRKVRGLDFSERRDPFLEVETDAGVVAFWGSENDRENMDAVLAAPLPSVVVCLCREPTDWYKQRHALWVPQTSHVRPLATPTLHPDSRLADQPAGPTPLQHLRIGLVVAGCAAIVGALPLPYGYYPLLRWLVTVVAALGAVSAHAQDRKEWVWLLGATAVIFNPLFPPAFGKDAWAVIDLLAGVVLLMAGTLGWRHIAGQNERLPKRS